MVAGSKGRVREGQRDRMSTSAIDFTKPSVARVYDVLAGGCDNFEATGKRPSGC